HLHGLLRGGRAVEEDERLAVDLARQDGKILAPRQCLDLAAALRVSSPRLDHYNPLSVAVCTVRAVRAVPAHGTRPSGALTASTRKRAGGRPPRPPACGHTARRSGLRLGGVLVAYLCAGQPRVALLLQLERQLGAAGADDAPLVHDVHDVGRDVVEQ